VSTDWGSAVSRSEPHQLPPQPRLPEVAQSLLFWFDTERFMRACERRHGEVFMLRTQPIGKLVVLSNPEHIKQAFLGDRDVFHAGEGAEVLRPVMGDTSILLLDGTEHLEQRKRMLPAFHGDGVGDYGAIVEQATHEQIDRWPLERAFPLADAMRAITLEVIMRAVIGATDPARLAALREALPTVSEVSGPILFMWQYPALGRYGMWRRYREAKERTDELLEAEIAAHLSDPGLADRTDVLSLLINTELAENGTVDQKRMRDQLITLLLAGYETTTTGLAWAFERLLRNPTVLDRLRGSLADGEQDYLDAVVKETLRVRPVIYRVFRKLTEPTQIAGWQLPADIFVTPAIGLTHKNPALWPDPHAFRPERFLQSDSAPYSWIPFGGGPRRCLGAAFATLEMKTVIRTVLSRTELAPRRTRPERTRGRNITLVPHRGATVVMADRRPPVTRGTGRLEACPHLAAAGQPESN
jgi:cytochrome P450